MKKLFKVDSFFNLKLLLRFYFLFYWGLQQMCPEHFLAFEIYWDCLWLLCHISCLSRFILNLLPSTFCLTCLAFMELHQGISQFPGFQLVLSNGKTQQGDGEGEKNKGMEKERRTKVGCLLPSYSSEFITSLLCCPLVPIVSSPGLPWPSFGSYTHLCEQSLCK